MALLCDTYDMSVYNGLPDLSDALHEMQNREDIATALKQMNELFISHQVQDRFRLSLLHKHFPLENGEKLVHTGTVSLPWTEEQQTDMTGPDTGAIVPVMWSIAHGRYEPVEFAFTTEKTGEDTTIVRDLSIYAAFIAEFVSLMTAWKLHDLLGLEVQRGPPGQVEVEVTHGRANITVPGEKLYAANPTNYVTAAWSMSPSGPLEVAKCKSCCKRFCRSH